jgi:RimJ/RimL family protein N-acetyltransferase
VPADRTIGAARRWIRAEPSRWNRDIALDWVIASPRTGELWGEIGLVPSRAREHGAEVGYWVIQAERGRGLARRGLLTAASWAFGDGEFDVLAARCEPSNPAAIATAEGAGFRIIASRGDPVVLVTRSPETTC